MKIKYDSNGFIWEVCSDSNSLEQESGYTIITKDCSCSETIIDINYHLPLYIYNEVTEESSQATPTDYQLDSKLWSRYKNKLRDSIREDIEHCTNSTLNTRYNAAPQYEKDLIHEELKKYWWGEMPEPDKIFSLEVSMRFLAEILYIQNFEPQYDTEEPPNIIGYGRSLTTDESTAFMTMLQHFRDHAQLLELPLSPSGWYLDYMDRVLTKADSVRIDCNDQEEDVMGELSGSDKYGGTL